MASIDVRPLAPDDIPAVEVLLTAKRHQYAGLSPVFWRPAPDAAALHEMYLQWLVADDANLCLTTDALDGVVIATPRDDGWLIDDFATTDWATTGRTLLAEARSRLDGPFSVVCAKGDIEQRSFLEASGLSLYEEWWVGDPALVAEHRGSSPTDDRAPVAQASIGPAPPVYDPGGPVALVTSWDGQPGTLAALADTIPSPCVLIATPVDPNDRQRLETLGSLGFTVASTWYR